MSGTTPPPRSARHLPLHRAGSRVRRRVVEIKFHTARGETHTPLCGFRFLLGQAGRRGAAPYRFLRTLRGSTLLTVGGGGCRFATTHIRPPQRKVTYSIPPSDFTVLLFLLSRKAQKKMDKGQYPLSAKRKCHTNIPAANILTLLPAAGARKRGLFEKSPLLTPLKTFEQPSPGVRRVHPKVRVSRPAAPRGARDVI